jgi:hypothetical protein
MSERPETSWFHPGSAVQDYA